MTPRVRTWRIDTVLGPRGAADLVRASAAQYMRYDGLDEDAAFRAACDLAASESAWLLARRGQVWELDGMYFATAEMPRRIRIRAVFPACGRHLMRIRFTDLSRRWRPWRRTAYLRVDDLDACYALTAWPRPPRPPRRAR
ncbi:hypothetical protein GCM10023205_76710 [Yinghuangia aomiensis]|uniref:Uncharacterized protein n=1 Tax=Yinghuangia aomiensis TaxID=676205 RepID=A0ABP9IAW2_9ACTN